MSDKHYIGLDVTSFDNTGLHDPISRVTLFVDDGNYYTAGDDSGKELSARCPSATQEMVNNILATIKGYKYQSYSADFANIDPAAEYGDGVTVGGVYSVFSKQSDDGQGYPTISAPGEKAVEERFPFASPKERDFNRKIAQTRAFITKTAEEIRLEVQSEVDSLSSSLSVQLESITAQVNGLNGAYAELQLTVDGLTVTDNTGTTKIKGSSIETGSLFVDAANISGTLTANQVSLTGSIAFEDFSAAVNNTISGISDLSINAYNKANSAESTVNGWAYTGTTYIDGTKILTGTVTASYLRGGQIGLINSIGATAGTMNLGTATSGSYAVELQSYAAMRLYANSGDMWLQASNLSSPYLWIRGSALNGSVSCGGHYYPGEDGIYNLGRSDQMWDGLYSKTSSATSSDRNEKNSISDIPEEYVTMFMSLRPRMYKYNKGTSGRYHIGYIAQEVEEAMQAAGISSVNLAALVIDYDDDGNKIYMLRYEEFIALHTLMIQRLVNQNG